MLAKWTFLDSLWALRTTSSRSTTASSIHVCFLSRRSYSLRSASCSRFGRNFFLGKVACGEVAGDDLWSFPVGGIKLAYVLLLVVE
eukprot:4726380-Pyramimonas_sp.AAC.1